MVYETTIIETKSYNPGNLRSNLVQDMKGKTDGKGLQMFTNVLQIADGKDVRYVFEGVDGLDAATVRNTFKEVVESALKNDSILKARIKGWYNLGAGVNVDRYIDKKILLKFLDKLNSNILVVN